jgi:Uma2 family endonuclease
MSVAAPLLTADELDQFPDDGKRREIIGGELHASPAQVRVHQSLVKRVLGLLVREIDEKGVGEAFPGPVDVRFSVDDQVQPDVVALRTERLDIYQGHIVHRPPDIVVEVLSPSTESYDRIEKKQLYETYGVSEYWLVDPRLSTVALFKLVDGRYVETGLDDGVLRSTAITDFTIDPAAIFATIKPT